MKRIVYLLIFVSCSLFGQAKKPTIMVVPSEAYCVRNGYVQNFDNQGTTLAVPDYRLALQSDDNIRTLIAAMGDFMAREEFPTLSLESELKRLQNEDVELSVIMGPETGSYIAENPNERLNRSAKADIILDLDYTIRQNGPQKQVSFNLTAIDSYTSKIISGNTGSGSSSSSASMTLLLQEAVLSFKDNFIDGLLRHFADMFANGREIVVNFRRYDSSPVDFDALFDYNGVEASLADIIGVWFEENTVNGRFSETSRSKNAIRYTQVRMPLYGKSLSGKEVAIDANAYIRPLVNSLKKDPYNLSVEIEPKGLGEVLLILGEY